MLHMSLMSRIVDQARSARAADPQEHLVPRRHHRLALAGARDRSAVVGGLVSAGPGEAASVAGGRGGSAPRVRRRRWVLRHRTAEHGRFGAGAVRWPDGSAGCRGFGWFGSYGSAADRLGRRVGLVLRIPGCGGLAAAAPARLLSGRRLGRGRSAVAASSGPGRDLRPAPTRRATAPSGSAVAGVSASPRPVLQRCRRWRQSAREPPVRRPGPCPCGAGITGAAPGAAARRPPPARRRGPGPREPSRRPGAGGAAVRVRPRSHGAHSSDVRARFAPLRRLVAWGTGGGRVGLGLVGVRPGRTRVGERLGRRYASGRSAGRGSARVRWGGRQPGAGSARDSACR
jgi:hypothetical protein